MKTALARLAKSSAVHMGFAFLAMGAWAVFANRGHAMPDPLLAGVVQGSLSACITLFLKRFIETLVARHEGLSGLVLPPFYAGLTSLTLLYAIHSLAGTPEILATITVPLTVATSYAALYTYTLWSARP
ncbi:hypothetical protein SAMN05216452_4133 [Nitratireductor aquibiodomus]|uniref:Uncharacterized protein n=1 Tax=Nitratireductor aquibiodomus TaxID=204799 RepID=A0A1H4QLJ0_9HYPH|nr:hypothetical protein [Nitratireductor aquibiodomus]SEC20411.1 hypothetical protein SAMN05216452_4133 [Nitratireductor aquibiodomus]